MGYTQGKIRAHFIEPTLYEKHDFYPVFRQYVCQIEIVFFVGVSVNMHTIVFRKPSSSFVLFPFLFSI